MVVRNYVPDKGDIVSLQFNPQSGKEQAGRRPALVLSPKQYNQKVGLALFCPITKQTKGYPFEVSLPDNAKTKGVVLSDHVKSLDWKVRQAQWIERLPKSSLEDVMQQLMMLLQ